MFATEQCLLVLTHHPAVWHQAAQLLDQSSKLLTEKGVRITILITTFTERNNPVKICFQSRRIKANILICILHLLLQGTITESNSSLANLYFNFVCTQMMVKLQKRTEVCNDLVRCKLFVIVHDKVTLIKTHFSSQILDRSSAFVVLISWIYEFVSGFTVSMGFDLDETLIELEHSKLIVIEFMQNCNAICLDLLNSSK